MGVVFRLVLVLEVLILCLEDVDLLLQLGDSVIFCLLFVESVEHKFANLVDVVFEIEHRFHHHA